MPGVPLGKPRMTRRDKWKKRECVLKYRDYCDRIREAWAKDHGNLPKTADGILLVAFLPVTASWSKKEQAASIGCGHQLKPDGDNILKSVCDALFDEDSCLWVKLVTKFWCKPENARTEISVLWFQ